MSLFNSTMKSHWFACACALSVLAHSPWAAAQSTGGTPQAQPAKPQTQPAKPAGTVPRPEDLEPGVNTSATPTPSGDSPAPTSPPATTQRAVVPRGSTPKSLSGARTTAGAQVPTTAAESGTTAPAAAAPAAPASVAASAAPKAGVQARTGAAPGKSLDRLELDTTQITGNRELPKVLYIVPWKHSDLGDLVGKPVNSLLDEVLTPVDRDVFRRENRYYDALKPDAGKAPAAGQAGPH